MKKFLLLFSIAGCTNSVLSQTLFTFGNNAVDKSEFVRAYNKNKTPEDNKEKAYREYLDLYIKFKLKVQAAKDLRLDTLPQLQFDAQSFRSQIEESYLNNEQVVNNLQQEAFYRSQQDLHVLHFFAPVDPAAKPEDTLKAMNSIQTFYKELSAGKNEFDKINEALPIKIKQNDLGFITVFSLPYEYENIIYALKPGQISKPTRTKNGWHVFKVTEARKAVGKWKIAQILISFPPDVTEASKMLYKKRADSIYQLLVQGEDFGKMARWFSDDKASYSNNGEMAEFGSGKYEWTFENEVFKLTKDKEISKPFLSAYGYHIIKRIAQTPVSDNIKDPGYQFDLRQKVQQDARINYAKDLFVKEIMKQVAYKKTGMVSDADMYRFADTVIAYPNSETGNATLYPIAPKTIFTFAKTKRTGKDWLDFVRNYKGKGELYQGESNAALANKFISTSVLEYYKQHLEDYNLDFRYQMNEFKDGNVLFEVMERKIWSKASADAAVLQKHYNDNKGKYLWNASADIIMFNCTDKEVAHTARAAILAGKNWKTVSEASENNVLADSGRFELTQIPVALNKNTVPGYVSDILVNATDGSISFIQVVRQYPANQQRNFEEAKGLVINDYQNLLEEKWIAELKNKYPVKVNEAVFQSLLK